MKDAGTNWSLITVPQSGDLYRLEPNPSFTPDMKYVVFRSNMFGPDYAFAVELNKADAAK